MHYQILAGFLAAPAWGATLLLAMLTPLPAAAQMPGLPVLQNAFMRGGIAVAANYGLGDETDAYGLAAAWTPRSERLQLTAGVGVISGAGGSGSSTIGGARLAVPIRTAWTGGGPGSAFGVALFGGVGSARRSGLNVLHVPVGVAGAYRWRIGQTRALSVQAAPHVLWARRSGSGTDPDPTTPPLEEPDPGATVENDATLFRASIGADFTLTQRFGLSTGVELGSTASAQAPGPTGAIFGIGLSYAF